MENMQRAPHLWTAGQERLDKNVGVVHFETVVPKSSGNPDGRQHAGLKKTRHIFKTRKQVWSEAWLRCHDNNICSPSCFW